MASGQMGSVLRHLRKLRGSPQDGGPTDAQLLERFAARREEVAFTALLRRHGPMVLAVCRRVLGNEHDAEDAFQATFLILARKAGSIHNPEALAGWLHEVARRTAKRARARAATRRSHERRAPSVSPSDFIAAVAWRDLQPVLDEEVARLPEKCRVPFVLCYLEGLTYERAAGRLRCAVGTISERLARARALLRRRLTRRGLALPAGILVAALGQHAARAAVPAPLGTATVKAVLLDAAGHVWRGPAAVLADAGLRSMTLAKGKFFAALLLAMTLLGLGAGAVGRGASAEKPGAGGVNRKLAEAGRRALAQPAPAPVPEKMTAAGRVLDASGKPVAGAHVTVMGRRKPLARVDGGSESAELLAQGRTGADGRFRLTAPRTSPARFSETYTLALAPGHGVGMRAFAADAAEPECTVRLTAEQVVRGRLVDLQGLPAPGVTVRVRKLGGPLFPDPHRLLWFHQAPAKLAAWPGAATTDAAGRFTLRGVPHDASFTLQMNGDRFAVQALLVNPDEREREAIRHARTAAGIAPGPVLEIKLPPPGQPLDIAYSLPPPNVLEGAVTYADTGKPAAQARLVCFAGRLASNRRQDSRTGADGRFRIVAEAGDEFVLVAYPPEGTPYLLRTAYLNGQGPKVARRTVNLSLPRGVLVRGKVTERPSGNPVAGASVEFVPRRSGNPFYQRDALAPADRLKQVAVSAADGTFALAVLPGPGHLLVNGPTPDYLHAETTERKLSTGKDAGRRLYPNAMIALDLKPQAGAHEVAVTLRRGVTVKGRLAGPDGKPVASAKIFYRGYIERGYTVEPVHTLEAREGEFELPGLDPDRPQPVFFLDAKGQLGAVVELPAGEAARGPLTVRLQRCGTAVFRPIGKDGKPVAGFKPLVEVLVSPGATYWEGSVNGKVVADAALMVNLDRRHGELEPDKEGRLTLPTLIPGATLRLQGQPPGQGYVDMNRTFTVEPGRTLDLKDLPIPMR